MRILRVIHRQHACATSQNGKATLACFHWIGIV
jgi:hypothetical protein